ncbi:MAG TPA: hypothetical protein ENJ06_01825 [Phycisphaeraceae bacterium]|nr:hypothetical protein [Phycisphaeraceae bacterium]
MKRTIPLFITAAGGFILVFAYFIPYTQDWGEKTLVWFDVIASFAMILGGGNLLRVHLQKVSDRDKGWAYSVVTLVSFIIMLIIGFGKVGVHPQEAFPGNPWSGSYREIGSPFWWGYEYALKPLTATMFSMLAFYIASAAFRAFRAKNFEAILLLGTAFIILLGRTAAGVALTGWLPEYLSGLRLENLTIFIMKTFNTAGNRAIMIGIALGIASMSLKVLLGVDRSYLGTGD